MRNFLHDKILGSLIAAAMGDAIGAPSEAMGYDEIIEFFGGPIEDFLENRENHYSINNIRGEVTDDTSQLYEMAVAMVDCGGIMTPERAAKALVDWADHFPQYYPSHAGPTTRYVIEELRGGADPMKVGKEGGIYEKGISNGSAMRIAPAALVFPGDLEGAARSAAAMTAPTHGTQHGYAGACAISCGIAAAMPEGAQLWDVLQACLYGARYGYKEGVEKGRLAYGLSVEKLIEKAIMIAMTAKDDKELIVRMNEEVGCNVSIQSSVAAAIGLFAAGKGEIRRTILLCANLGGDTDTIACIAGMLAGAYSGYHTILQADIDLIHQANPQLDMESVAEKLADIAAANYVK